MPDLSCSPNIHTAFNFFVSKGLRDFQAAGIVGNLMQESGINPNKFQYGGGVGRGIAQWTESDRWQNVIAYARQTGRSEWSLNLQLDFLWHELQSNPSLGLDAIKSTTTLEAATVAFQGGPGWGFERCDPKKCETETRITYARRALFGCSAIVPPRPQPHPPAQVIITGVLFTLSALTLAAAVGYVASWELERAR